ncbi:MAG: PAS domain S-box protein [Balneolales bacterium]
MNRLKRILYGNPFLIATAYLIISAIWITYSDYYVLHHYEDTETITLAQSYKGWFFITVSALFIYILVQLNNNKLNELIQNLEISKKEFEATFEQAAVGIVHHMPDENLIRVNQKLCDIFGYSRDELLNMRFEDFITSEDLKRGRELDHELIDGKRDVYATEKKYIRKDGRHVILKITKSIVHNGRDTPEFLVGIIEDITKQKQAEEAVIESLKEKEVMLSEIHHRVKNNLAVITGLIELQMMEEENEQVKEKLRYCDLRIKIIANIHQELYRSENLAKLYFDTFLKEFIQEIAVALSMQKEINLEFNCRHVLLDVNQAILCSLIVNEVVNRMFQNTKNGSRTRKMIVSLDQEGKKVKLSIQNEEQTTGRNFKLKENLLLQSSIIDGLAKQLIANYNFEYDNMELVFTLQFDKSDINSFR